MVNLAEPPEDSRQWQKSRTNLGDCQNYGPLLGPYYNTGPNKGPNLGDPKRDHNFDNPPPSLNPKLRGS